MAEANPPVKDPLGGLEGLNTTFNGTASGGWADGESAGPSFRSLLTDLNFIMMELKLLVSAIGIIYVSAHASLRRPPSAAVSKSAKGKKKQDDEAVTHGMEMSDAVLFPLLAGVVLVGLYYLIQWLKDPAILNKLLKYYMSTVSVMSLVTIYAHSLEFVTGLVFPKYWRTRNGPLQKVDQRKRIVVECDAVGNPVDGSASNSNPLPGFLSLFAPTEGLRSLAWEARDLFTRNWVLKLGADGMGDEVVSIKFAHMLSLSLALVTSIVYFSTSWATLSNVLAYGMCYTSLMVLSPTNFLTGCLVLSGLFIYDIVMVFYTPYMITVATTLDVPIKLTFETSGQKSILGLGDIVIPGMVMGWALRLDLWIHYLRKVKYEKVDLKIITRNNDSGEIQTDSEEKHKEVKSPYINAKNSWGDRLWTRGSFFLFGPKELPSQLAATQFRKTYFHASLVGYLLAMIVTVMMLVVFKHGQPALLYLVPGVIGSLLVTSLARGEIKELWTYSEDGSLDTIDVVVDLDKDGKPLKEIGKLEDGVVDLSRAKETKEEKEKREKEEEEKKKTSQAEKRKKGHNVFLISLDVPSEDDEEDE